MIAVGLPLPPSALSLCVCVRQAATAACDRLPVLQEFRSSSVVKVNPDKPQERARFHTLRVSESCLVLKNFCVSSGGSWGVREDRGL